MGPLTQWRGQSDTTLARFGWGFLMSVLLHLPLTPLAALFGLLTLLTATKPPPEALPPLTGIPVDLIEGEEAEVPPPATPPPPAPEPAVALEPPAEKPRHVPSEPKIRDAGVSDAEPSDAAADADAGTEGNDAGLEDGGITDPVAASGAERALDVNANVQIKIFTEKIRNHPLAGSVGQMLASVPQWRDFFGPAALDPIADVDRLLIAGPQLRNSSEVAVVVKVNVPQERVRAALDGIVRADPNGAWLDAGVPMATARVDRAERRIILVSPSIVVITPPTAADSVLKQRKKITIKPSTGDEVVTAKVVTPWRAFRGSGIDIDIPKSIQWVRFKVSIDRYSGAIIEFVAKDESPEKASDDASRLEHDIKVRTTFFGMKFIEKVVLTSQGDEIHGAALVTLRQLRDITDFLKFRLGVLQPQPQKPKEPAVPRVPEVGAPSAPAPEPTPSPVPSATSE